MPSRYVFGKAVELEYEQALERVTQALAKEGFSVLTEIAQIAAEVRQRLERVIVNL